MIFLKRMRDALAAMAFAVFACAFACPSANAALNLEITGGRDSGYPIAVADFGARSTGMQIAGIIRNDLQFSGKFYPSAANIQYSDKIDLSGFVGKARAVVVGNLEDNDGHIKLSYKLINVSDGSVMLAKVLKFERSNSRRAAHTVSNQIFESITGIKGAFLSKIAYVSVNHKADYPYSLVVADYDGYGEKAILRSKEPVMSPSWDPKGNRIAYVSFESRRPEIYLQNVGTKQRYRLAHQPGINGSPVFSPDGSKLAIVLSKDQNPEIYVLDIESRKMQRMTNNRAIDTEPSWSRDGKSIFFTSDRGGRPQIYRLSVDNPSDVTRVTWENTSNQNAAASPTDNAIVMVSRYANAYRLTRQDLDTGYMLPLTDNNLDESPSFAPNGTMVIYSTVVKGHKSLALVSSDGRFRANLPSAQGIVRAPAWSSFME